MYDQQDKGTLTGQGDLHVSFVTCTTCVLFHLLDAVPKNVNTLPSKVTVAVQQKPKPLCGKDRTSVISDENLEQNYVLPDSSSPENTSLEFSDTRK